MSKREDADEPDYGPPEYGVRSSDIGSFMPEGAYRPVPIVWLAGAWFLHTIAMLLLFMVLMGRHPGFVAVAGGLLTFLIARWTWQRGMAQAAAGWQVLTGAVLLGNLGLVTFGAFAVHYG